MRKNDRQNDALRPVTVEHGFQPHADGSVFIRMGDTHVICSDNRLIEVQCTAEGRPFERDIFDRLVGLAQKGVQELLSLWQKPE